MTHRHCDPVTMDHIIELRKRVALLEKQLENALSYVRPLFEQQRRYLGDIGSSTIRVGEETKFSRDARSFNGERVMDEVPQERLDDAWDEGFAHGYSRGNEEGLKIAFKDGYDFGAKTVSAKFADEIERLRGMLISALDGLDEYWVTFPEGVELVNQIKALQQKEKE